MEKISQSTLKSPRDSSLAMAIQSSNGKFSSKHGMGWKVGEYAVNNLEVDDRNHFVRFVNQNQHRHKLTGIPGFYTTWAVLHISIQMQFVYSGVCIPRSGHLSIDPC